MYLMRLSKTGPQESSVKWRAMSKSLSSMRCSTCNVMDELEPNVSTCFGFPGGSVVKNLPAQAGDPGLIPGLRRSPGRGNGNPLKCSCLENPMDREAWRATVYGVMKESDMTKHTHMHMSACFIQIFPPHGRFNLWHSMALVFIWAGTFSSSSSSLMDLISSVAPLVSLDQRFDLGHHHLSPGLWL